MKKNFLFTLISAAVLLFSTIGCEKEGPAPVAGGGGGKANLTIETVSGPDKEDCGGFNWKVKFNLNEASATGGWIVQKITYDRNVIKCPDIPFLTNKITYWEAWRVAAGANGDTDRLAGKYTFDDQYSSPNYPDTRGSITITGEVKFFEGLALPASFTKGNKDTYAGDLPATTGKPDFWDAANTAGHNLSYIWNCCIANGISVLATTPDSKKVAAVIPADTSKLDYIGKLIYRIPAWPTGNYTYTEINMQLVNLARQVQYSSTPASLLNALGKYENTFAGTTDYVQHMSKAYLLLRVLYQLPQQMNGNAKTFGGWIHPGIGTGSAYNMSWPVTATAGPAGIQVNVDGYTGFLGRTYNAAVEMSYFNANFQKRNL